MTDKTVSLTQASQDGRGDRCEAECMHDRIVILQLGQMQAPMKFSGCTEMGTRDEGLVSLKDVLMEQPWSFY